MIRALLIETQNSTTSVERVDTANRRRQSAHLRLRRATNQRQGWRQSRIDRSVGGTISVQIMPIIALSSWREGLSVFARSRRASGGGV